MRDLLMPPEQAAWVYEHVILGYHDANEANSWCDPDQSDDRLICACQLPCTWCRFGQHERCLRAEERQQEAARHAAVVLAEDGGATPAARPWRLGWGPETYLRAPGRWRPPTRKRPLWLPLWLADRVCRYLCACSVCKPTAVPSAPAPVLLTNSEQLGLFEAVAS